MLNEYEAEMPDFMAISGDAVARVEDNADTVADDAAEAL